MPTVLRTLAQWAVLYAYPLYEMSRMRAVTAPRRTLAGSVAPSTHRWCNVFTHTRKLIEPGDSRVVTPNNDTLYTNAWLNLADGPLVIDVPDTQGRYYVLGLLDFYTNPFAHLGQRLTGTQARSFLVTPPGWDGEVPEAFARPGAHVQAPTPWLWIIGRILVDGADDLPVVHALQDRFTIRSLQDWQAGKPPSARSFDPAFDAKATMDAANFASVVNAALRENPPPAEESALMDQLALVGIGTHDAPPSAEQLEAIQAALVHVLPRLRTAQWGTPTPSGWVHPPLVNSSFAQDFSARAHVALKYIGMLESREAMYPLAWNDAAGDALTGECNYRLRFACDALPPVDAFWSVTVYDAADYGLVANPIHRYAIGDRTPGLLWDDDGGLTLHIQHAAPQDAGAAANWLPAPAGRFYLVLRAYMPHTRMLDGSYPLPALVSVGIEEASAS